MRILYDAISDMKEKYAQVWTDITMMETVVSCLLFIGTSKILDGKSDGARAAAYYVKQWIKVTLLNSQAALNSTTILEANTVDEHTLVRFFQ